MYKSTIPVLFLLFSSAAALTSYTYTATTTNDATYNQVSLGTLASTDVITFLMEFPNPATGASPTQFYLAILDNAKAPISQPSGFGSSNMSTINFSGSNTLTWTVSTAGAYNLRIGTSGLSGSLVPYHLTVTNSNGGLIVKDGDFVRNTYIAIFELTSLQSTYSILKSAPAISFILRQVVNDTFTTVSHTSSNSSEATYSNLTAGSYAIQAFVSGNDSITYQSDSFNCPSYYDPNFPFTSQGLQACTSTAPTTTTTTASGTTEDNSTRKRNIALITVFTFVAVAGLAILIIVLAKKSASAGASTAVAAANESSHVNIQNANSSNPNTAQVNNEPVLKEDPESLKNLWMIIIRLALSTSSLFQKFREKSSSSAPVLSFYQSLFYKLRW